MLRNVLRLASGVFGVLALAACSNSQPAPQGQAVPYGQPATVAQAPAPTYPAPTYSAPTYTAPAYASPAYGPSTRVPAPPPPPTAPRMAASAPTPSYSTPSYSAPAAPAAPYAAPTPTYSAPAPSYPAPGGGAWRWHTRIADAQADARAQGKMILVTSTKPNCGLCEKFKGRIVPEIQGEVAAVAVGYVYDITAPEDIRVDRLLRGNLPGATLMPLVGFVTPELQWIHGFYGQTDANQFRGDLERAKARYPARRAAVPTASAAPTYAMLNEYGEYEWSPSDEVVPEDALTAEESAPALASTASPSPSTSVAMAPAAATPIVAPYVPGATRLVIPPPPPPPAWPVDRMEPVATRLPETAAPVAARTPAAPETFTPYVHPDTLAANPAPAPAPQAPAPAYDPNAFSGSTTAVVTAPWSDTSGAEATRPAEGTEPEAWAETMLGNAMDQIQAGRLDEARITLTQVLARMSSDSALGLEAARGTVAIYNVRKLEKAAPEEKARVAELARRDLGDSRWARLFE